MGYLAARDMAEHADLDQALAWHLAANLYPPASPSWRAPAKAAVLAVADGFPEMEVTLTTPLGEHVATAQAIVDALRLEAFVEVESAEFLSEEEGLDRVAEHERWLMTDAADPLFEGRGE
jgi:hypothetical protein